MKNAEQSVLQKASAGGAGLDEAVDSEDRKAYGIAIANQNARLDEQMLSSNEYRVDI